MNRIAVVSAAALIGAGSLVVATNAEAQYRGHHRGGAIAAGVIGGLATGALIGAASGAYAAPAYGYAQPGYGAYQHRATGYGYAPAYGYTQPVYGTYQSGGYAPAGYGYAPAYGAGYSIDEESYGAGYEEEAVPLRYGTARVVGQPYGLAGYDDSPRALDRPTRVMRAYDRAPGRAYVSSERVRNGVRAGNPNARNPSRRARGQNLGQTSGGYMR